MAPPHKASWVAGWRTGEATDEVAWSDVNTGPIQHPVDAGGGGGRNVGAGPVHRVRRRPRHRRRNQPVHRYIYSAEAIPGLDPNAPVDPIWIFNPGARLMPWTESVPGAIARTSLTGGIPGDICPQGWEEDFDRSQMSTQVLIGRQLPSNIPTLHLQLSEAGPPDDGELNIGGGDDDGPSC